MDSYRLPPGFPISTTSSLLVTNLSRSSVEFMTDSVTAWLSTFGASDSLLGLIESESLTQIIRAHENLAHCLFHFSCFLFRIFSSPRALTVLQCQEHQGSEVKHPSISLASSWHHFGALVCLLGNISFIIGCTLIGYSYRSQIDDFQS